jgi:hypothetical protein
MLVQVSARGVLRSSPPEEPGRGQSVQATQDSAASPIASSSDRGSVPDHQHLPAFQIGARVRGSPVEGRRVSLPPGNAAGYPRSHRQLSAEIDNRTLAKNSGDVRVIYCISVARANRGARWPHSLALHAGNGRRPCPLQCSEYAAGGIWCRICGAIDRSGVFLAGLGIRGFPDRQPERVSRGRACGLGRGSEVVAWSSACSDSLHAFLGSMGALPTTFGGRDDDDETPWRSQSGPLGYTGGFRDAPRVPLHDQRLPA